MKRSLRKFGKKREAGVALLLSIFVLLAISVVAISMIVASGTESSLAGNYRNSTSAYYAAMAGLEEGRGRLLARNPNYLGTTLIPSPMAYNKVVHILNPASGESASSLLSTYPDNEYANEFGSPPSSSNIQTITSSTSLVTGVPVPLYKWVRVNPVTELSLGRDVNYDTTIDRTTPLYYDTAHTPSPSLIVSATPPASAQQALEVTALAVLPNGSEKLLQYVVAAKTVNLNLNAALSFGASSITFNGANSSGYMVDGQDGSGNPGTVTGCTTNPSNLVHAIAATNATDVTSIVNGIPGYTRPTTHCGGNNRSCNYTGLGGNMPDVSNTVALPGTLDTPADAYQTIQTITQAADLVVTPPSGTPAGNSDLAAAGMSATNPKIVVVQGDLTLTGNFTGYGLLVVTGNFHYSGNDGWKGIVLVIGDGTTTYDGNGGGNNEFDGAVYVSTIWDANHNLLSSFGPVGYDISGGGGNGVYYNSCWIKSAEQPSSYQVLSFREIPYHD